MTEFGFGIFALVALAAIVAMSLGRGFKGKGPGGSMRVDRDDE